MLVISESITIPSKEIEFHAVRSQGSGGQHVNKVSTAIHLKFDIKASSLPEEVKRRLLTLNDHRISRDGIIIIKAQEYRSQKKNKELAMLRLRKIITGVLRKPKRRIPTKPTKGSRQRRLESKSRRSKKKALRKPISSNTDT